MIKNFNTIKVWLYSKEFKENYQDKNHPYPSLLNPNKIDYESIPAELAWEMNLPFPRRYALILLLFGLSGQGAFGYFLRIMGVFMPNLDEKNYSNLWNLLNLKSVDCMVFLNFRETQENRKNSFLTLMLMFLCLS